jgi:hypothetical protein
MHMSRKPRSHFARRLSPLALLAALALLALPAFVAGHLPDGGGRPFVTAMTGDEEAPGPGHPEATGTAFLRLNPGQEEVSVVLTFEGFDPNDPAERIAAGHIHIGQPGVPGPVVVSFEIPGPLPLDEDGSGSFANVVSADREVILDIIRNPGDYYVNLHSANFPPGAIRGQLSR